MPSKIEWTEETWNPITGCTKISSGCKNCYAERMSKRLAGRFGYPKDEPFRVTEHENKLEQPLSWRKHRRIFVCSMSDLFHQYIRAYFIYEVFKRMALCPQHTFIILTKRPARMKKIVDDVYFHIKRNYPDAVIPLPNVWLGVTSENQEQADKRIPILLQIPAAVRFVSVEPMLGPVDLNKLSGNFVDDKESNKRIFKTFLDELSWVIIGAESGPRARKINNTHILDLLLQCSDANVPVFLKQAWMNDKLVKMPKIGGQTWAQYPGHFDNA